MAAIQRFLRRAWVREFTGELIGTFLLCYFGLGANASNSYTTGTPLWSIPPAWGLTIAIAIFTTGSLSGAHLNPAASLSFALVRPRDFGWRKLAHYLPAQFLGAFLGAWLVYAFWSPFISDYELSHNITRGAAGSHISYVAFGLTPAPPVTLFRALCAEAAATWTLLFVVFALTDKRNAALHGSAAIQALVPLLIGSAASLLIVFYAPLTQAGLNPARDFSPRLLTAMVGWGAEAIPGPNGCFWLYILGPLIGGPLGAAFYEFCVGLHFDGDQPPPLAAAELNIPDAGHGGGGAGAAEHLSQEKQPLVQRL